jgi:hypothetical protein
MLLCILLCLTAMLNILISRSFLKQVVLGPEERLFVLETLDNAKHKHVASGSSARRLVVLSSSLGIHAASMSDALRFGIPRLDNMDYMKYSKWRVLDEECKKKGLNFNTLNLSNSAMMISEQNLLLNELLRKGFHPDLIILELAPRDFIDHYTAGFHRSRLAQILQIRQSSLNWHLKETTSENIERLLSKVWSYYSQRVEIRDYIIQQVCVFFDRAPSLFSAQQLIAARSKRNLVKMEERIVKTDSALENRLTDNMSLGHVREAPVTPTIMKRSLSDYNGRYLPVDKVRFKQEMQSLNQLLLSAFQNKISVLVVEMPLTSANKSLLPKDFVKDYQEQLNSAIRKFPNAEHIDLFTSNLFVDDDFTDSCHLRGVGGAKLVDHLVDSTEFRNACGFSN